MARLLLLALVACSAAADSKSRPALEGFTRRPLVATLLGDLSPLAGHVTADGEALTLAQLPSLSPPALEKASTGPGAPQPALSAIAATAPPRPAPLPGRHESDFKQRSVRTQRGTRRRESRERVLNDALPDEERESLAPLEDDATKQPLVTETQAKKPLEEHSLSLLDSIHGHEAQAGTMPVVLASLPVSLPDTKKDTKKDAKSDHSPGSGPVTPRDAAAMKSGSDATSAKKAARSGEPFIDPGVSLGISEAGGSGGSNASDVASGDGEGGSSNSSAASLQSGDTDPLPTKDSKGQRSSIKGPGKPPEEDAAIDEATQWYPAAILVGFLSLICCVGCYMYYYT